MIRLIVVALCLTMALLFMAIVAAVAFASVQPLSPIPVPGETNLAVYSMSMPLLCDDNLPSFAACWDHAR